MTEHFNSQADLFEEEPAQQTVEQIRSQRKRNSLGFKLPLRLNSSGSSSSEMADTQASGKKGKGKGGNQSSSENMGGTSLGLPEFTFKEKGSLLMYHTDENGNEQSFNLFMTTFVGKDISNSHFEQILNYVNAVNGFDLKTFVEGIVYQGFDRLFYTNSALKRVSISVFVRFAIIGAVRGSNFEKIVDSSLNVPEDLKSLVKNNVVIKTARKRDDLTILRFTASIPHWVAYWLQKVAIDKKISNEDCPACLQFPGAASLPMSKTIRLQHISFCRAFSNLLPGGVFNPNIYLTAYNNPIPIKDIPVDLRVTLGITGNENDPGLAIKEDVVANLNMSVVPTKR